MTPHQRQRPHDLDLGYWGIIGAHAEANGRMCFVLSSDLAPQRTGRHLLVVVSRDGEDLLYWGGDGASELGGWLEDRAVALEYPTADEARRHLPLATLRAIDSLGDLRFESVDVRRIP